MTWDDFIKAATYDPGNFDFTAFLAAAQREHDADVSVRDAKINQLTEQTSSLTSEVGRVKAANYDLLMSKPVEQPPGVQETPPEGDTPVPSIDDLFEKG